MKYLKASKKFMKHWKEADNPKTMKITNKTCSYEEKIGHKEVGFKSEFYTSNS